MLNSYLLNIDYAAGSVLGAGSRVRNKLDVFASLCRAYIIGVEAVSQINYMYIIYCIL